MGIHILSNQEIAENLNVTYAQGIALEIMLCRASCGFKIQYPNQDVWAFSLDDDKKSGSFWDWRIPTIFRSFDPNDSENEHNEKFVGGDDEDYDEEEVREMFREKFEHYASDPNCRIIEVWGLTGGGWYLEGLQHLDRSWTFIIKRSKRTLPLTNLAQIPFEDLYFDPRYTDMREYYTTEKWYDSAKKYAEAPEHQL